MEAPFLVAADHYLPVIVATIMGKWADIPATRIKFRPSHITKFVNVVQVAKQPRRLFAIRARVLTLVASNCGKFGIPKRSPDLGELPNTRRFTSVGHAEVLRVLEQAGDLEAQRLRRLGGFNAADGQVHKLIAGIRPLLLKSELAGEPPGILTIPARLGPRLVCPISSAP